MKNKDKANSCVAEVSTKLPKNHNKRLILSVEMEKKDLLILKKHAIIQDRSVSSLVRGMIKQFLTDRSL